MSSESNFSFTLKINGDLFTVRGDSPEDFTERILAAPDLVAAVREFQGIANATALTVPQQQTAAVIAATAAHGAPVNSGDTPASTWEPPKTGAPNPEARADAGAVPHCDHGPRNYKEGVSGKGPWKAYFCSAPQGTAKSEQCDPLWFDKKLGKFA